MSSCDLESRQVFQSCWGLPYLFELQGAVCAEDETVFSSVDSLSTFRNCPKKQQTLVTRPQEYLLPWEAFETLAESIGFRPQRHMQRVCELCFFAVAEWQSA